MYSRYFDPFINNHLSVNKHHTSTRLAYIEFSQAYHHNRHLPRFAEPISAWGVKEGKTGLMESVPQTPPVRQG